MNSQIDIPSQSSNPDTRINFVMGEKSGIDRVSKKLASVIDILLRQGQEVTYSNLGFDSYYLLEQDSQGKLVTERVVDGSTIGSGRDMTGKHKKPESQANVPMLNEQEVIAIARNKADFYRLMSQIDAVAGTVHVHPEDVGDLEDLIDSIDGDRLVLKPVIGNDGKGLAKGSKSEIYKILSNPDVLNSQNDGWVVQQEISETELPKLRGISEDEELTLRRSDLSQVELRMFTFAAPDGSITFVPLARVFMPSEDGKPNDQFVYIDPESLPDEAAPLAQTVVTKIMQESGTPYIFGAIDLVYGGIDGQDKRWFCMEANVKEPIPVNRTMSDKRKQDSMTTVRQINTNLAQLLIKLKGQKI